MTRLLLELTVEGEPRAKGRPRFANGHAFTPAATRAAESAFAWEALKARKAAPTTERLRVHLDFFTKTKRKVDLDNLSKLVLDALNGRVWADDSQIVALVANRHTGDGRPRTVVRVYTAETGPQVSRVAGTRTSTPETLGGDRVVVGER